MIKNKLFRKKREKNNLSQRKNHRPPPLKSDCLSLTHRENARGAAVFLIICLRENCFIF